MIYRVTVEILFGKTIEYFFVHATDGSEVKFATFNDAARYLNAPWN